VLSKKNFELINQLYDPKCIVHQEGKTMSLGEAIADGRGWVSAAPDFKVTPDKIEAEGEKVNVHWTARGTNTGTGHGITSPSGKVVVVKGHSLFVVANGKITEVFNEFNEHQIFEQVEAAGKKK